MKKYSPYKMKGHTLPGIKQKSEGDTDTPEGRSASSALQYKKSPLAKFGDPNVNPKAMSLAIRLMYPAWIMKGVGMQMKTSAMAKGDPIDPSEAGGGEPTEGEVALEKLKKVTGSYR